MGGLLALVSWRRYRARAASLALGLLAAVGASALELETCRLPGLEQAALCGQVLRPLDPTRPQGRKIEVHFAVVPALARSKKPDPVFFFAGGPGQSAIDLAGPMTQVLARLATRRDLVFIDQRGTGRSAALHCNLARQEMQALAQAFDEEWQIDRLRQCRERLQSLPHGDLRQYTTTIAMADVDAVRQALGASRINVVGASYGTRAVLEFMRLYPGVLRRAVIDGVAPPDMALPAAFSMDNQAALEALLAWCAGDAACAQRYPGLRERWRELLGSLPRKVTLVHPYSGAEERVVLGAPAVLSMLRSALYVPALTSALPAAIAAAADGHWQPLLGLASSLALGERGLAAGMHFSVICAEDMPRLARSVDQPGGDFGGSFAEIYRRVCGDWPIGEVPEGFYTVGAAPVPVWVLSGGADPATAPRHGARVAHALGARAFHTVAPGAGHGTIALPCLREHLFRFIDADTEEEALAVRSDCASRLPRAALFVPPDAQAGKGGAP